MKGKGGDVGLFRITSENVDRVEGSVDEWVDANMMELFRGAHKVLRERPESEDAVLAKRLFESASRLSAYRRSGSLEPALWEMMCFMTIAMVLDANLAFARPVMTYAKTSANLRRANVTKEQTLDAIACTQTLEEAAEKLDVSVRWIRDNTSLVERQDAMAKRKQ
jgi:hypothetical protein